MARFTLNVGVDGAVYLGKVALKDSELFCISSEADEFNTLQSSTLAHDLADHNYAHRHDVTKVTVEEELQAIGAYIARVYVQDTNLSTSTSDVAAYALFRGRPLKPIPFAMKDIVAEIIPFFFTRKDFKEITKELMVIGGISRKEAVLTARLAIHHVCLGYHYTEMKCEGSFAPADRYAFILEMANSTLEALQDSSANRLVCIYDLQRQLYSYKLSGERL